MARRRMCLRVHATLGDAAVSAPWVVAAEGDVGGCSAERTGDSSMIGVGIVTVCEILLELCDDVWLDSERVDCVVDCVVETDVSDEEDRDSLRSSRYVFHLSTISCD